MKLKLLLIFFCSRLVKIRCAPKISGPLTDDFSNWLYRNGYSQWESDFRRDDLGVYGSYGGRSYRDQPINKNPVIFIHGNSDQALDSGTRPGLTGWTHSITHFLSRGYTSAELYATTWGPANFSQVTNQVHSCSYLNFLRRFTEAVIHYTGASKINMVSHSMGVTLARKVAKGGLHKDQSGAACNLGAPLTANVDTFIGISGGNRGLVLCFTPPGVFLKACNKVNGFFPGFCPIDRCKGNVPDMSEYLAKLNQDPHGQEGQYIFTIWSRGDEAIMFEDMVWGYPTSEIPGQQLQPLV